MFEIVLYLTGAFLTFMIFIGIAYEATEEHNPFLVGVVLGIFVVFWPVTILVVLGNVLYIVYKRLTEK